jgi:hypothetical protein
LLGKGFTFLSSFVGSAVFSDNFFSVFTTQHGQGFQGFQLFYPSKIFCALRVRSRIPKMILGLVSDVPYNSSPHGVPVNLLCRTQILFTHFLTTKGGYFMGQKINILFIGKKSRLTKQKLLPIYLRVTIDGRHFEASTAFRSLAKKRNTLSHQSLNDFHP